MDARWDGCADKIWNAHEMDMTDIKWIQNHAPIRARDEYEARNSTCVNRKGDARDLRNIFMIAVGKRA
jgi:hypothetical protein